MQTFVVYVTSREWTKSKLSAIVKFIAVAVSEEAAVRLVKNHYRPDQTGWPLDAQFTVAFEIPGNSCRRIMGI